MICVSIVSHGQHEVALALLRDLCRLKPAHVTRIVYTANIGEANLPSLDLGPITVELISNAVPKGFGANHNAAFRRCREPYFCIMNPDLRLPEDPFPALISAFDDAPLLGLVAPAITDPSGALQNTARLLYTPVEMLRQKLRPTNAGDQADWLAGMFLLLRTEAYASVGGFDERYFLYIEDVDLGSRLTLAGWQLRQIAAATVIHDARKQSHRSFRYMRWHLAGMLRYWAGQSFWHHLDADPPSQAPIGAAPVPGRPNTRPPRSAAPPLRTWVASLSSSGATRRLRSFIARLRRYILRFGLRRGLQRLPGSWRIGRQAKARYAAYIAWRQTEDRRSIEARPPLDPPTTRAPRFSILMPTYETDPGHLKSAVDSVIAQILPDWELVIVDDASPSAATRDAIRQTEQRDPRIRAHFRNTNGHISAASMTALELAQGEFIVLLDHDDALHPMALYRVAEAIKGPDRIDLVYSDEDKLDESGQRSSPYFKSELNLGLLLSQNMISHLGVYRREAALAVGGFRTGYEGAQDHDLALRVVARSGPGGVRHLPEVLYHWRLHAGSTASRGDAKPYARRAGRRAIRDFLLGSGSPARVAAAPESPDMYRVLWPMPSPTTRIEIFIADSGQANLAEQVDRCLAQTLSTPLRITIIDTAQRTKTAGGLATDDGRIRRLPVSGGRFVERLHRAMADSRADRVVLLAAGVVPLGQGALAELVASCESGAVGLAGGRVWSADWRLQRGGIMLAPGGRACHVLHGHVRGDPGPFGRAVLQQDFTAVSTDWMAARRDVLADLLVAVLADLKAAGLLASDSAGGDFRTPASVGADYAELDVGLSAAIDVALGLAARARGLRNYWTPYAQALSRSRADGATIDLGALAGPLLARWRPLFDCDPCYRSDVAEPTCGRLPNILATRDRRVTG